MKWNKLVFKWSLILTVGALSVQSAQAACDTEIFNITASEESITVGELLGQISKECRFTMIVKDKFAKQKLREELSSVYLSGVTLDDIFKYTLDENNLMYTFDGKMLKINYLETKTFKLNYINTLRYGSSSTNISMTTAENTANSGASNTATGSYDTFSFWNNIQSEIRSILTRPHDDFSTLIDSFTRGAYADDVDNMIHVPEEKEQENQSVGGGGIATSTTTNRYDSTFKQLQQKHEQELLKYSVSPHLKYDELPNIRAIKAENDPYLFPHVIEGRKFSSITFKLPEPLINKEAGLITVTGNMEQLRRVEEYINQVSQRIQQQVMIDVSILALTHSNDKSTGINWNKFQGEGSVEFSQFKESKVFRLFDWTTTMDGIISFLQQHGDVTTLSNPKVVTLNNQPALISVGDISYYVERSTTTTGGNSLDQVSEDIEYKSQFSGVLLDITPSIHNNEIMLKINPSVSKMTGEKVDEFAPPNLSTNQLSSVITVEDGSKVVLGGLISKSDHVKTNKVPLLGDIPLLGTAFRNDTVDQEMTEMVIIITPHIIKHHQTPSIQELGYSQLVNEQL